MLVIAVIAIIFVGPKDLPSMLRTFGRFSRKVRGIAGDFQRQVDDALREAELDQVRDSINDVRSLSPKKMVTDHLKDTHDDLSEGLDDVSRSFDDAKAPEVEKPVEVDVEAALERQREADRKAEAAKPRNSGANAVPGFASSADGADEAAPVAEPNVTDAAEKAERKVEA